MGQKLTGPSKYKFLKIRWAGAAQFRWAGPALFRWAGPALFKWSAPPQPNYHKKAPPPTPEIPEAHRKLSKPILTCQIITRINSSNHNNSVSQINSTVFQCFCHFALGHNAVKADHGCSFCSGIGKHVYICGRT